MYGRLHPTVLHKSRTNTSLRYFLAAQYSCGLLGDSQLVTPWWIVGNLSPIMLRSSLWLYRWLLTNLSMKDVAHFIPPVYVAHRASGPPASAPVVPVFSFDTCSSACLRVCSHWTRLSRLSSCLLSLVWPSVCCEYSERVVTEWADGGVWGVLIPVSDLIFFPRLLTPSFDIP